MQEKLPFIILIFYLTLLSLFTVGRPCAATCVQQMAVNIAASIILVVLFIIIGVGFCCFT
jgi:hypothetical protein